MNYSIGGQLWCFALCVWAVCAQAMGGVVGVDGMVADGDSVAAGARFFAGSDDRFQYTGRIDFSDAARPRGWSSGVYVQAAFRGRVCVVRVDDEVMYGTKHNYVTVVVDSLAPYRVLLTGKVNRIVFPQRLGKGRHVVTVSKCTESGSGYIAFAGLECQALLRLPSKPIRRMECIGNSITCGTGSDVGVVACGAGQWEDQHNAWLSYGARTARALGAQYQLTSVSGIGLLHSCCGLTITMPQVFDKMNLRADSLRWDFGRYQPDVVTMCLGQNDGVMDSVVFCGAYDRFLDQVHGVYPKAKVVLLVSPMADSVLAPVLKRYVLAVSGARRARGEDWVSWFAFSRRFHGGCDGHPDVAEHGVMAGELAVFVRKVMGW